jgi:type III restriction enzyme
MNACRYFLAGENKKRDDLKSDEVKAKATAAVQWRQYVSDYAASVGSKPWKYLLAPHDEIVESKRLVDFLRFEIKA